MEIDYKKLMEGKTGEGLLVYLEKTELYTEEAIVAAMSELQKRGRQFSANELETIKERIEAKRKATAAESGDARPKSGNRNIVDDPAAPAFYTQRAILGFSAFFSTIFGAALLASNLKGQDSARWLVWLFGIAYTGLSIYVLSFLPNNGAIAPAINGLGGLLMTQVFWNKYLGQHTKHRAKAIWKPLIISLLITIPLVVLIILGGEN